MGVGAWLGKASGVNAGFFWLWEAYGYDFLIHSGLGRDSALSRFGILADKSSLETEACRNRYVSRLSFCILTVNRVIPQNKILGRIVA